MLSDRDPDDHHPTRETRSEEQQKEADLGGDAENQEGEQPPPPLPSDPISEEYLDLARGAVSPRRASSRRGASGSGPGSGESGGDYKFVKWLGIGK